MTDCPAFMLETGFSASIAERFHSKYIIRESGCHEWTGGFSGVERYGSIRKGAARHGYARAPRVAWMLANRRPIPTGKLVRHTCDNPPCVNALHLVLGTDADNANDKVTRGRQPSHKGVRNPNRKLTEQDVRDIRRAVADGDSQASLARAHAVSEPLVSQIIRRVVWKEVV